MSTWAKIKFYHDSIPEKSAVVATATSTESTGDYKVINVSNPIEGSFWQAEDFGMASVQELDFDAGSGNSYKADYFAIIGHNMNISGATITLQYSDDDVAYYNAFTGYAPTTDTVQLKEFTATALHRYWKLKISSLTSTAPYIAIIKFGLKTELDYASASFDPHYEVKNANVNISYGGVVTGIHEQFTERRMSLKFSAADPALYALISSWWNSNGLKNFFVAWEFTGSPAEVFLMRSDKGFNNPLTNGGAYRNITVNLKGRKE